MLTILQPKIQGDATKLVKQVSTTNMDLQKLGGKILGKHRSVLRIRNQQGNIMKTIHRMNSLLPILRQASNLEAKMKLGKYYSALKIIQLIRHEIGLRENAKNLHFSKLIVAKFGHYQTQINKTSELEFKNYLESV